MLCFVIDGSLRTQWDYSAYIRAFALEGRTQWDYSAYIRTFALKGRTQWDYSAYIRTFALEGWKQWDYSAYIRSVYRNLEIVEMRPQVGKDTITGCSFSVRCADDTVLTDGTGSLTINGPAPALTLNGFNDSSGSICTGPAYITKWDIPGASRLNRSHKYWTQLVHLCCITSLIHILTPWTSISSSISNCG
jgi:hypothetical protein